MPILLTTAYLPPIPYMAAALRSDTLLIEAMETYAKRTHRNHTRIMGPNGIHLLSIPVTRINGSRTMSCDIRISKHEPWQKNHWRSLNTAYRNAPFFLYYADCIQPFYEKPFEWLLDFNGGLLNTLLSLLRAPVKTERTETYLKHPPETEDARSVYWDAPGAYSSRGNPYIQAFSERIPFAAGLSIVDALFNLGPETASYLSRELPDVAP